MAIFTPGVAVGQISGRVGGNVFSHNRGGQYIRNGSVPVNTQSSYRAGVRAAVGAVSHAWQALTDAQRKAWNEAAGVVSVVNRLGRSISLNGQQYHNRINIRLAAIGSAQISLPPLDAPPVNLAGVTLTADIGAGSFALAWTSGAIPAGCKAVLRGCVVPSNSVTFISNLLRGFTLFAPAATSPQDIQTALELRFGTVQVGQVVWVEYHIIDTTTGLISNIARISATVVDTP